MSSMSDDLVHAGYDITSLKYYLVAAATILFYDYFLTLPDEVRYAWNGKKSWVFVIFILNRYMSMAYMIWLVAADMSWAYTDEMCDKTAFIEMLSFLWSTLIAQIILTARIYAITMKNPIVTGVFTGHREMEIAFTAISLVYDSLAFLVIVIHAVRSGFEGIRMSRILRTIVQDTTIYFMVIFTSHFVFVMTLLLERPILQLLPGVGNFTYLPVMIGRLMLSLKKAAEPSKPEWSLETITSANPGGYTSKQSRMRFAPMSGQDGESRTDGDIPLRVIVSPVP